MKTNYLSFLLSFLLLASSGFSQKRNFPQQEINDLSSSAFQNQNNSISKQKNNSTSPSSISKFLETTSEKGNSISYLQKGVHTDTISSGDTIFVGFTPNDTLRITGTWTHTGPIIVVNNGVLIFKKANATIVGDIYVIGHGKAFADSSTLYFPQQWWYQRSILAVQDGYINFSNSTFNYGGFPHSFGAMDSSVIIENNISNTDYTTTGMNGHASITINGDNLTGEFIIDDYVNLHLKHATQCLLWHQFPDTAVINYSFPAGTTINSYTFNKTISGVKGIEYHVTVDTSNNVEWALMPVNGSDVTVSNSTIRSIGLWFIGADTVSVSGLVDNSNYSNFTAPLTDRNFQLINTSVKTWSLYPMNTSLLTVSGCILGEVGTENKARINGNNYWVDGSGGYWWSADTSLQFNGSSTASCNIRSEKNGMMVFAYGSENNGAATAIGNSILIVVQSTLPQDPVPYEGGDAWFANIGQPASGYVDTIIPIIGSAWINKGPTSALMDFSNYRLYYQKSGDTVWTAITSYVTTEVHNNSLAQWDTHGLTAGNYNLELILNDNWGDSVAAEKAFTLLPAILVSTNTSLQQEFYLNIFPNPSSENVMIDFVLPAENNVSGKIYDIEGKEIMTLKETHLNSGYHYIPCDIHSLNAGTYVFVLTTKQSSSVRKFFTVK